MTCGTHCPRGFERGAPGRRLGALGVRLRQRRGDDLAGAVAPPRRAGVGREHDRAHDAVAQRVAVAVGEVGVAAPAAVGVGLVADERDALVGPGAERRAGQAQPAGGELERGRPRRRPTTARPRRGAPRRGSPASAWRVRAGGVQRRLGRHLGVGRDVAAQVGAHRPDGVAQRGVQRQAGRVRRRRPTGCAGGRSGRRRRRGRRPARRRAGGPGSARRSSCPTPGVAVTRKSRRRCSR